MRILQEFRSKYLPIIILGMNMESSESFVCRACQANFSNKEEYRKHIMRPHKVKNQRIPNPKMKLIRTCDLCNKTCKNEANLDQHKKEVHEKKEPLQCSICKHSFHSKRTLSAHFSLAHANSNFSITLSLRCSKCQKSFRLKQYLDRHIEFNSC